MTTIETITDHQIHSLRAEAAEAGDRRTVDDCDRVIARTPGWTGCLRRVVAVINDAEAMADDGEDDDGMGMDRDEREYFEWAQSDD
jgi:hypothetical protein